MLNEGGSGELISDNLLLIACLTDVKGGGVDRFSGIFGFSFSNNCLNSSCSVRVFDWSMESGLAIGALLRDVDKCGRLVARTQR
jgi:hypothetical protein